MKKALLIFLLYPFFGIAQETVLPRIDNHTLFTTSGYKIIEGENIKIGVGTMPDGDFKFIRRNAYSLFNYTSEYRAAANSANAFNRTNSGLEYKVIRVERRGDKKHGFKYYAVINQSILRFEIDVDNAIAAGELVVPDEFKMKNNESMSSASLGDELKKLKDLFDSGAITKEEYDTAKKKVLGN
jgi:hypothetical protein